MPPLNIFKERKVNCYRLGLLNGSALAADWRSISKYRYNMHIVSERVSYSTVDSPYIYTHIQIVLQSATSALPFKSP